MMFYFYSVQTKYLKCHDFKGKEKLYEKYRNKRLSIDFLDETFVFKYGWLIGKFKNTKRA